MIEANCKECSKPLIMEEHLAPTYSIRVGVYLCEFCLHSAPKCAVTNCNRPKFENSDLCFICLKIQHDKKDSGDNAEPDRWD